MFTRISYILLVQLAFILWICQAKICVLEPPPSNQNQNVLKTGRRFQNATTYPLPGGIRAGCQGVQGYPSDWPNSYYYQRMCYSAFGLSVVTDGIAPDEALERTAWTLDNMLATVNAAVPQAMIQAGFRQAVMGRYPFETVTSLPEYSDQDPNFWNTRRGCGATDYVEVGCNAEEDVLCYADDLYPNMDVTVHEFGHSLHWLGFNHVWPQFQVDLDTHYNYAYANSLWGWGYVGSYAMTNSDEYWAQGLMAYFDVQYPWDDQGAPATREQLYQKDPDFADFLDRWMSGNPWRGGCPS